MEELAIESKSLLSNDHDDWPRIKGYLSLLVVRFSEGGHVVVWPFEGVQRHGKHMVSRDEINAYRQLVPKV